MDFFEHQEQARKRTGRLVLLFILAVIAIIAMVYLVVVIALPFLGYIAAEQAGPAGPGGPGAPPAVVWWQPWVLLWTSVGVLVVVAGGSTYKIAELRQGGERVASMLGGRAIPPDSEDANEQKVLNVVEEMAIASGTSVPPVYVLPRERGINAFAAGFTSEDAIVAVTRGTIEQLSRDELQGVIAHEFSHIHNSDMRTNIRLMGVIHGIVVLSIIGLLMVRFMFYGSLAGAGPGHHGGAGGGDGDREGGGGGKAMIVILVAGVALIVIGYVGAVFGKMIKAAVSRQREYLADASAVQFTRNPEGLAGALKKIGGLDAGSRLGNTRAEEASHMFFGQSFQTHLTTLFATHPPLVKRIRKLDPSFKGEYPELSSETPAGSLASAAGLAGGQDEARPRAQAGASAAAAPAGRSASGGRGGGSGRRPAANRGRPQPDSGIGRIGEPTSEHLQYAGELIRSLPEPVRQAAREPYGARAVVYALLLDPDEAVRRAQWEHLAQEADPQVHKLTQRLAAQMDALEPATRLPLLDMSVPALRQLSPTQYETFNHNLDALIQADDKVELFEWMIQRTLRRSVAPNRRGAQQRAAKFNSLRPVRRRVAVLLSALAYVGHTEKAAARQAFEKARQGLAVQDFALRERHECRREALDEALTILDRVSPREKRSLLTACGRCIAADKKLTVREVELLRLIADSLHCPMPPVLAGQPVA